MSEYTLSYTGAEVNELLSTVSDNHDAWDSISQAEDYVIELGTSGYWGYRKWSSGIAECWCAYGSISVSNSWNNHYIASYNIDLPFSMVDLPYPQVSVMDSNVTVGSISTDTTTSRISVFLMSPISTSANVYIDVKGMWK